MKHGVVHLSFCLNPLPNKIEAKNLPFGKHFK